jgi:Glycogen recognition site of AMP-activated protein kinase
MRRAWLIPLCLAVAIPARLSAQWQVTADAGAAHLRQPDIPEANAATLGASAEVLGDAAWFRSTFLAAHTGANRWTGQGVAVASVLGPSQRGLRFELSGSVSGFSETNATSATSGEVMGRAHLGRTDFGGALGFGVGRVHIDGSGGALYHGQADIWRSVGDDRLIGSVSLVDTRQSPFATSASDRVSYADLSANWRRDRGALSIGVTGGVRVGRGSAWGAADASLWLLPHAAIVAAVGRSLEDVTRGVPQTQYASLAIRLAVRPQPSIRSAPPRNRGPTVIARRAFLEVRAPGASTVEVMGDFTNWSPVTLSRDGDVWRLTRALRPGPHRIALRVDGGEWTTPVNLPRVTDDLGGVVGLMTVP